MDNNIYCQNLYPGVYFGIIDQENDSHILLDENLDYSEFGKYFSSEYAGKLIQKHSNSTDFLYNFYEYFEDFKPLTKLLFGTKFFVSSEYSVSNSNVIGYRITSNYEDPINCMPILQIDNSQLIWNKEKYSRNIVVCSVDNNISKINYNTSDNLIAFSYAMKEINKLLTRDDDWFKYHYQKNVNIIEGNFTKFESEILVSYSVQIDEMKFNSGIFLLDTQGNFIDFVKEFLNDDYNYNIVIGTIDLENDGILEILVETGYYEGSGYELWSYKENKFVKICNGLYYGS
ncbi:MAG: hypothetical protein WAT71_08140 [Ignavibacteria bacterium]